MIRRACLIILAVVLALTVGCKGKPSVREPDAYRYRIAVRAPFPISVKEFTILLNNAPLEPMADGSYSIPRSVRLSDPSTKLVAIRTTTCGVEETPLDTSPGYTRRDEESARLSAARYDQTASWPVFPRETWDARSLRLYVDNLDNERAITLKTGTATRVIAAHTKETVVTRIGHCTEATTVSIDGELLGTAEPTEVHGHTLVDTQGGHCYMVDTTHYGSSGIPELPQLLMSTPTRRLHRVPTVQNLFRPNPLTSTVSVEVGREAEATDVQRALLQVPCAASPKKKKHGTARRLTTGHP